MKDDSFKSLMVKGGVKPIKRDIRIRTKERPSQDNAIWARARAEDTTENGSYHGLSTDQPPPIDPLKPLQYIAYGIDRGILELLDTAPFPSQHEIDLHGYTVDEAASAVAQIFQHIRDHRLSHIRITHGVGRHSQNGRPILKALVNRWLKNNPDVIAFASARRSDGGTGVVNILTKALTDDRWRRI